MSHRMHKTFYSCIYRIVTVFEDVIIIRAELMDLSDASPKKNDSSPRDNIKSIAYSVLFLSLQPKILFNERTRARNV